MRTTDIESLLLIILSIIFWNRATWLWRFWKHHFMIKKIKTWRVIAVKITLTYGKEKKKNRLSLYGSRVSIQESHNMNEHKRKIFWWIRINRLPQEILNYYSKTAGSLSVELCDCVELDWMEQKNLSQIDKSVVFATRPAVTEWEHSFPESRRSKFSSI